MKNRYQFLAACLAFGAVVRAADAPKAEDAALENLKTRIAALAEDPDPRVRMQAAFTIGGLPDGQRAGPLARIAAQDLRNEWTRKAILSSTGAGGPELFLSIAELEGADGFLREVASLIGARNQADEITRLVNALPDLEGPKAGAVQVAALKGLKAGLELAGVKSLSLDETASALAGMIAANGPASPPARGLAPVLLGRGAAFLDEDRAKALTTILAHDAPLEERLGALRAFEPRSGDAVALAALLHASEAAELQAEVIARLDRLDAPEVGPLLASAFPGLDPLTRNRALEALYGRQDRAETLIGALEEGRVNPAQVDSSWRVRLLNFPDAGTAAHAARIFKQSAATSDPAIMEAYRPALDLHGDPAKGSAIHEARCAQCHRVGKVGFDVGPSWGGVKSNPPEKILTAILYPNQSIAAGFTDYVVELVDGEMTTGLIAASSPASITLRRAGGEEEIILRRNIKSMRDTAFSLMPENLYEGLAPQDFADLLAFISGAE